MFKISIDISNKTYLSRYDLKKQRDLISSKDISIDFSTTIIKMVLIKLGYKKKDNCI